MSIRTLAFCILFFPNAFVISPANAYDQQTALENLADDFADCTIYYNFVVAEVKAMHKPEATVKQFQQTADATLALFMAAMKDHSEQQLRSKAKLDLHLKILTKMREQESMDRLVVKFSDRCKSLIENPAERMKYWTEER